MLLIIYCIAAIISYLLARGFFRGHDDWNVGFKLLTICFSLVPILNLAVVIVLAIPLIIESIPDNIFSRKCKW